MNLEQQCKECLFKTANAKSFSNHVRFGCNYGRDYQAEHYQKNRDSILSTHSLYRRKIKREIFNLLGNVCDRCGFDNKIALQIDHINGGGYAHRKSIGITRYYGDILKRIKSNTGEFRLLCANCNQLEAVKKGHKVSIWN